MTSYENMTMREAATHYLEQFDWVIIPNRPNDKKPSIPDWNKHPLATYDDVDTHYQMNVNDNIGIHPKYSGLIVLDFDNHPDEEITTGPFAGSKRDGVKSFNEMLNKGLLNPKAITLVSPSGGLKQLYRIPKGYEVKDSKDVIAPGVEVICVSHQAVIPPSVHPAGGKYKWNNSPDSVVDEDWELLASFIRLYKEKGGMTKNDSAVEPQTVNSVDDDNVKKDTESSVEVYTPLPNDIRDIPVAEWIYENFKQDIIYVMGKGDKGEFHIYDGTKFEPDRERGYQKFIKKAVKRLIELLDAEKQLIEMQKQSKGSNSLQYEEACRRLKDSKKYLDYKCMTSLWNLMKGDVAADTRKFDSDYNLLNFRNYTLEIDSWTFREHRQSDMLRKCAPVDYDPGAKCPKFTEELVRAFNGNEEEILWIQVFFGRTLLRKPLKGWAHFFGQSDVGKTTILNTVMKVLGDNGYSGYSVALSPNTFSASKSKETTRNDLLMTMNCCIIGIDEKNADEKDDSSFLKAYTGGGKLNIRGLYESNETMTACATIINTCNKLPPFDASDSGMVNRQIVIPFEVPIREKIPEYWDILYREESSGILNWLLEGLKYYQDHGMPELPLRFKNATEEYKRDNNVVERFLLARCSIVTDSVKNRIRYVDFEDAFRDFCMNEEGIQERYIPGKKKILDVLRQKNVEFNESSTKIGSTTHRNVLKGIRLESQVECDEELFNIAADEALEQGELPGKIRKMMELSPDRTCSYEGLRECFKASGVSEEKLRKTIGHMLNRTELMPVGEDIYELIRVMDI